MNSPMQSQTNGVSISMPPGAVHDVSGQSPDVEAELAQYLPHLNRMSEQLRQTSSQIESSVMDVCNSFQGIAQRAKATVGRTKSFLIHEDRGASDTRSFERLIENCSTTLVKILNVTEEAGKVSCRAIERIRQMDKASQSISAAIQQLEQIAGGNKILALNARIEAARAGSYGAGFGVVAMEVLSQTEKSQKVNAQVSELVTNLRALAESTLEDLKRMNEKDLQRVEQCKYEVHASLSDLEGAHGEMKQMLTDMTEEGDLLANDIGSAVRGLQFQDRTSQRIAHVIEDLDTLCNRLSKRFADGQPIGVASNDGFTAYTMYEEREVAGIGESESGAGEVELF